MIPRKLPPGNQRGLFKSTELHGMAELDDGMDVTWWVTAGKSGPLKSLRIQIPYNTTPSLGMCPKELKVNPWTGCTHPHLWHFKGLERCCGLNFASEAPLLKPCSQCD